MEFLDTFLEEIDVESKLKVKRKSSKEDIKYETEGNTTDDDWCLDYPSPPPPQVTCKDIFVKGCAASNQMDVSLDTSSTESCKTLSYSYINTPKAQETQASPMASKPVSRNVQP